MYDSGNAALIQMNSVALTHAAADATEGDVDIQGAGGNAKGGVVTGIILDVTVATVFATLPLILAVHVDDVEVATATIPTATTVGHHFFRLDPVAGKNPSFGSGQTVELEIKQQGTGAGLAGSWIPYFLVHFNA